MKDAKKVFKNTRIITGNPLDFLERNNMYILNGHYASICYINYTKMPKNTRYTNKEKDEKFKGYIDLFNGSKFSDRFSNVRNSLSYKDALEGKAKTFKFNYEGEVYLVCVERYNFHWKDAARKLQHYEEDVLPIEQAIRKHHGFSEEADHVYPENDWHLKPQYKGGSIFAEVLDKDKNKGKGWVPMFNEFYVHENTKNLAIRQILNKNTDNYTYKYYYVQDSDGILEPFDLNAFYFLKESFGSNNVKEKCEELLEEEQQYVNDMTEAMSTYKHVNLLWKKTLYMAVTAITKNENGQKEYLPFLWINTDVIKQEMPWLNDESLNDLLYDNVNVSKKELDEHFNNPALWNPNDQWNDEHIMDKIQESIMIGVDKALSKLFE